MNKKPYRTSLPISNNHLKTFGDKQNSRQNQTNNTFENIMNNFQEPKTSNNQNQNFNSSNQNSQNDEWQNNSNNSNGFDPNQTIPNPFQPSFDQPTTKTQSTKNTAPSQNKNHDGEDRFRDFINKHNELSKKIDDNFKS